MTSHDWLRLAIGLMGGAAICAYLSITLLAAARRRPYSLRPLADPSADCGDLDGPTRTEDRK